MHISLPLALLALIKAGLNTRNQFGRHGGILNDNFFFLNRNAHVASVSALATITLVLADALIRAESSVLASLARALAIAAFLALAASLAPRLRGEVFLVSGERAGKVQRRGVGGLARVGRQ